MSTRKPLPYILNPPQKLVIDVTLVGNDLICMAFGINHNYIFFGSKFFTLLSFTLYPLMGFCQYRIWLYLYMRPIIHHTLHESKDKKEKKKKTN